MCMYTHVQLIMYAHTHKIVVPTATLHRTTHGWVRKHMQLRTEISSFTKSLQHTATYCNTLQHTNLGTCTYTLDWREALLQQHSQHTATHYNTLQQTYLCICTYTLDWRRALLRQHWAAGAVGGNEKGHRGFVWQNLAQG